MQVDMEILKEADILLQDHSLCRVCLSCSKENKCIFTTHVIFENYQLTSVWKKLRFYGGIKVSQTDGFPSKICNNCISKLRVVEEFRKQCKESDKKLKALREKKKYENCKYDKINEIHREQQFTKKAEKNSGPRIFQNTKSIETEKEIEIKRIKYKFLEAVAHQQKLKFMEESSLKILHEPCNIVDKESITSINGESSNNVAEKTESFKLKAEENPVSKLKKKPCKRLLNFRRITSMENLKKYKERQRQYVKRTKFAESGQDKKNMNNCKVSTQQLQSDFKILQYKCTKCCRIYKSKKLLEAHQSVHGPERFGQFVEFLEDPEPSESNSKSKPSTCKICNKKFRKSLTMVRHLHVHKRENPRAVYAILKEIRDERRKNESIFYNENNLSLGMSRKVSGNEIPEESMRDRRAMSENSNIFVNRTNDTEISILSRAEEIPEKSEIPCDNRSAIKLINTWIREELDSDNEGKGFPCNKCNKSYVTKKSLLKHASKMHNESSRCNVCSEYCTCNIRIQDNSKNALKSKEHRCNECEKTFEQESKLEKHLKIHKREKEQEDKDFKRFLCHICSKTFRHNTGLMFHMRTHTGYKPHVCKYCGRGFTSNSNCINHERTHTGDRPFVCHFCSAAFAKSCTLKAHITMHTGEANYHCKTCGKSFRRLKYLKEHKFTHTGEKPYACKICGTAYSHSGSLFVHEKKCKAQHNDYPGVIQHFSNERTTVYQPNLAIDFPILTI